MGALEGAAEGAGLGGDEGSAEGAGVGPALGPAEGLGVGSEVIDMEFSRMKREYQASVSSISTAFRAALACPKARAEMIKELIFMVVLQSPMEAYFQKNCEAHA